LSQNADTSFADIKPTPFPYVDIAFNYQLSIHIQEGPVMLGHEAYILNAHE
jgi:hypothetical protein